MKHIKINLQIVLTSILDAMFVVSQTETSSNNSSLIVPTFRVVASNALSENVHRTQTL